MPEGLKITAPERLEVVSYNNTGRLDEGEILLRVKAGGICGSDLHIYDGSHPIGNYPKILGHEFAGVVEEVGRGVTGISSGDKVAVDPIVACGQCPSCKTLGRFNICSNLRVRGVHLDGGFCTHIVLPAASVHQFRDLDWKTAVLAEPFTIAAQILDRCRLREKDTVLINGVGAIGLSALLLAKLTGARVVASDLYGTHLDKAMELGADAVVNPREADLTEAVRGQTGGVGVSAVIESVGASRTLDAALRCAAPGARIAVIGFDKAPIGLSPYDITFNEWELVGSRLHTHKFGYVLNLFESGRIDPSVIVSHVFPFKEALEVFPFILKNPEKVNKVILEF